MKPHGSTRPPKWPFLLGDAALITVAVAIWLLETGPLSDIALVLIFSCFFLGTALGVTPFLLDFSAARHDDLIEAREGLESLAQKLSESADFIGTVAGQLHALNESTLKAIHLAEALPYKMQEKVGEVAQLVQQGQDEEKESMAAELEELRESESRHFETAIDKARVSLDAAVKRVEAAEKALAAATSAIESRTASAPAVPAPSPVPAEAHAKESHAPRAKKEPASPAPATVDEPSAAAAAPDHAFNGGSHEAAKHRETAKHAKPEKLAHAIADTPAPKVSSKPAAKHVGTAEPAPVEVAREPVPAPPPPRRKPVKHAGAEHDTLPGLDPVVVRDEEDGADDGAAAKTSDGSTRLLVTAYIGIGNKVFVRGDGPGLNAEKGKPMEFVSIGKWLWQTSEATAPVTLQVYKNDEVKALGDDITIDPGHHVEVTPVFREANPF